MRYVEDYIREGGRERGEEWDRESERVRIHLAICRSFQCCVG